MKKRENVKKLLKDKKSDWVPAGFWIHFPKTVQTIDDIEKAHEIFAKETNLDISKIMNENEFRAKTPIEKASEWAHIKQWDTKDALFQKQKDTIQTLLKNYAGKYYTLGTIHGITASMSHSSGIKYTKSLGIMKKHYEEDPVSFKKALDITYENVKRMLEVTLETDVDGIYYAALGGERHRFTDAFFEEVIAPYDIKLLEQIKDRPIFLHMCKDNVELKRFKDYPCDVVNWAVHESEYSLKKGAEIFPDKILLGGLDDRSGVIVDGTKEEIEQEVKKLLGEMKDQPFILGADCTLPTEIEYERIRIAVDSAK